jgi:molecular chaperone DnaK
MARVIGIDLGTTNSCVATLERGTPTVLRSPEGERTTPSVVAFKDGLAIAVGVPARRQMVTNAASTVLGTKRLIGRKVNAPDVQAFARAAPFAIVAAQNGDAWVRLPERDVSPQELSSYVLEHMRRIAEAQLGEPVTQCVVTVPAYFNDAQRQATKDAGRIAGLDVRRILPEPTAAALAYGVHRRKVRQRLAVFDLGGGTFDISVLCVERGVFEVLSTSGDAALGGDDFDRRIVEKIAAEIKDKHDLDLGEDAVALGRLKECAEAAKQALSDQLTSTIRLPFVGKIQDKAVHVERVLERGEVEAWTLDLLSRLAGPCEQALKDAGLEAADLDEVLLVGGMTRMPAVQAEVERIFGKKPSKGANPDEIVALGAALHGGILSGELDDVVLLDVTPHSLGIRVGDAGFSVLIPRNTTVPARVRKLFATSRDDQPYVAVEVYQGESQNVRDNRHLGRFTLDGLPPGKAGTVRLELSFLVDADGIVSVSARELSTGRATTLTIAPSGGLGDEDMDHILEARRLGAKAE